FREVPLEWIVAFLDTRLSCRFSLRQPREFLSALACLTVDGEPEACRDLYVVAAEDAFVDV
ncbi:hypothetical protein, partial [Nocardia farcinica]|uniref:hypothetical protein n=1 Tax=Nocardia farcinica TaxID=37329 RepID=UPI001C0F23A9